VSKNCRVPTDTTETRPIENACSPRSFIVTTRTDNVLNQRQATGTIVGNNGPCEFKEVPLVKPHLTQRCRKAAQEVTHAELVISRLTGDVARHELHYRLRSKEDVVNDIDQQFILVVARVCNDRLHFHLHDASHPETR
jgi:hypothetical protein